LDIGGLSSRLRLSLKVGFGRVIRVPDVIIRTGSRLFVICGESIDRRGIDRCPGFSFHIPQAKVFENLFDHIRILFWIHHKLKRGAQLLPGEVNLPEVTFTPGNAYIDLFLVKC
jgi:hypothetical protein